VCCCIYPVICVQIQNLLTFAYKTDGENTATQKGLIVKDDETVVIAGGPYAVVRSTYSTCPPEKPAKLMDLVAYDLLTINTRLP